MNSLPFTGTTEECLQNFFWRHKWENVQRFVAEYVGVDKSTVRHWKGGRMPSGDPLLRLRVLLSLAGYMPKEYEVLAKPIQRFAQVIALGLINVREAADLLGYKNIQDVYGVVLRGQGLMPHRLFRLERYVENSADELEEAVAELRSKLEQLPRESTVRSTVEHLPEPQTSPAEDLVNKAQIPPDVVADLMARRLVQSLQRSLLETHIFGQRLLESTESSVLLEQLREQFSDDELRLIVETIDKLVKPAEAHR